MFRVTSLTDRVTPLANRARALTEMPEAQLNRLIKRIGLLFLVALIAFVAFYAIDRWRPPAAPTVDQRLAAAEAAVEANPGDIAVRGQLADLYVTNGRYEEAVAQYDQILETGKETLLAHLGRAFAYKGMGELDRAAADFQVVVDFAKEGEMANVDPVLNTAYYGLGDVALQQGRTADAIASLEAALRIKRSDADTLNLLGAAYLAAEDYGKAIDATKRAITFVPLGWSEPYETLAAAYSATNEPERAEWALAMADLSAGDAAMAENRLRALVDGDVAVDAAIGLGLVFESQENLPEAAGWYEKALALEPDNAAAKMGFERVSNTLNGSSPLPGHGASPSLPAPSSDAEGNG